MNPIHLLPFFSSWSLAKKKGRTEEKVFYFRFMFFFFFLVVEQKACRSSCGDRLERTDYYWRTWRNIANVVAAGCAKVRFSFYFFLVVVVIVAVSCELRVFVSFRCLPAFFTSFFLMCFFFCYLWCVCLLRRSWVLCEQRSKLWTYYLLAKAEHD